MNHKFVTEYTCTYCNSADQAVLARETVPKRSTVSGTRISSCLSFYIPFFFSNKTLYLQNAFKFQTHPKHPQTIFSSLNILSLKMKYDGRFSAHHFPNSRWAMHGNMHSDGREDREEHVLPVPELKDLTRRRAVAKGSESRALTIEDGGTVNPWWMWATFDHWGVEFSEETFWYIRKFHEISEFPACGKYSKALPDWKRL